MQKIKGFRISLRPAEVKRRAKKAGLDLPGMGLDDLALEKVLATALKAVSPSVLYETFKHPDPDAVSLAPLPGLAYSLVLATLGPGFPPAKEQAGAESAELRALWTIVEETALDEAVRFVAALLEDESAKESCTLTPWSALRDPEVLEAALRKLDGSKIDLSLRDGRLEPAASAAVSISWLAQARSRGKKKD